GRVAGCCPDSRKSADPVVPAGQAGSAENAATPVARGAARQNLQPAVGDRGTPVARRDCAGVGAWRDWPAGSARRAGEPAPACRNNSLPLSSLLRPGPAASLAAPTL